VFEQVLAEPTQSLLERLSRAAVVQPFYLAGGSALALQLGHRTSQNLDWFTESAFDPVSLGAEIASIGPTQITEQKRATLVAIVEKIEVGFYRYQFPLLFATESYRGCAIASWKDILCMKLAAIGQSAAKRDYVDLYFGFQNGISLRELLDLMKRKYASVEYSAYHLLRSLTYFDEVEAEPMPTMLINVEWSEIRTRLEQEVRKLGRP